MSSTTTHNINLPVLPDWVQQHVRTLYSAKTQQAFDAAFDAFVSQDARITLNGKHLSRENYKNTIRGEVQGETGATVTFKDVVAVPAPKTRNPVGAVGAFFTAELFQRFIVFGARQSNIVTSSLNVEVVEELSANPGFGDPRRVSVLNEVLTDKPSPIRPPTAGSA